MTAAFYNADVLNVPAAGFHYAGDTAVRFFDAAARENAQPAVHDAAGRAWVVFSGQTDVPWLRWLRPGFRHCFVVLHDGTRWLTVDPMLHRMDVHVHAQLPADFDLPRWLESRGQLVVPAAIDLDRRRPAPWRPFTCVEAVKRVLGLHARFVLTPWQLYRHLTAAAARPANTEKEISAWAV